MVQRLTISLDDDVADAIDGFMRRRGYTNRSEAIRDLVRDALAQPEAAEPLAEECVAAVSYVYDHHQRQLASRLAAAQHERHDLVIATMHAHLDHRHCLEVALLRGPATTVRQFADSLFAERGLRFGRLNLVPMRAEGAAHAHGTDGEPHIHRKPAI